ncbi:MAG: hypothetical protein AUI85_13310 [Acidobacteriales bacterium 13_1_40CM_3_55_5]|nr:MAG: hypothetical protein AUI85_13310 [Acidobacteriales bacterium 13_1_40CM_3_55_5]
MRQFLILLFAVLCCSVFASSQTADELISKNIKAKGGMDAIKAIKSVRMAGRLDAAGGFTGRVGQENMRPNLVRETFSLQGMTAVQAYDGSTAWQIQPFGGHKDPQLMGEDDVRDLLIDSDFDGPLVDYKAKGNTVEYLGHDTIDGDDVLRLKVTLKNGDIVYYYLDPDTFLEIRTERQEFVRGSVRENVTDLGSYKKVAGLMYPFSIASGPKNDPSSWQSVTMEKIEVNVPLGSSEFAVPASLSKEAPKKQEAAKQ